MQRSFSSLICYWVPSLEASVCRFFDPSVLMMDLALFKSDALSIRHLGKADPLMFASSTNHNSSSMVCKQFYSATKRRKHLLDQSV